MYNKKQFPIRFINSLKAFQISVIITEKPEVSRRSDDIHTHRSYTSTQIFMFPVVLLILNFEFEDCNRHQYTFIHLRFIKT